MAKIMLVRPPFARLLGSSVYLTYPLGPMLVAGMLKQRGHEVVIYHDDVSNPEPIPDMPVSLGQSVKGSEYMGSFISALDSFSPDVVGMSYRTADADAAHAMMTTVREMGIRTVAGGIHPTLLKDAELEYADVVVIGEGDNPSAAAAFEGVDDGVITVSPAQPLGDVVADRNCVIGGGRYSHFLTGMIETQRGCPYGCSYCAAPAVFGKKVRLRDPGLVREEVESLSTISGRIIDDSFGVVRKHGLSICNELSKTRFHWVCDIALQNVDAEFCDALVNGGCTGINIGLESGAEKWRTLSGKKIHDGQAELALEVAQDAGLNVVYYFIIGFPGETKEELRSTLRWANELKLRGAKPCISTLTPYPGTVVWDLTNGMRDDTQGWSGYFHQSSSQGFADVGVDEWGLITQEANRLNG